MEPPEVASSTPAPVRDRTSTVRQPEPPYPRTPEANVKKILIASVLSLGLFSACLGPNKYWNKLHDWNTTANENRWVNEGIFLVFTIIPVYGITYLADIVVFNSIEWWSGKDEGKKM